MIAGGEIEVLCSDTELRPVGRVVGRDRDAKGRELIAGGNATKELEEMPSAEVLGDVTSAPKVCEGVVDRIGVESMLVVKTTEFRVGDSKPEPPGNSREIDEDDIGKIVGRDESGSEVNGSPPKNWLVKAMVVEGNPVEESKAVDETIDGRLMDSSPVVSRDAVIGKSVVGKLPTVKSIEVRSTTKDGRVVAMLGCPVTSPGVVES